MRDQDRAAARSRARQLEPELDGVVAGIDDDGLGRTVLGAHDVAVLLRGAEDVRVHRERHGR
jgi:hypothetical protein